MSLGRSERQGPLLAATLNFSANDLSRGNYGWFMAGKLMTSHIFARFACSEGLRTALLPEGGRLLGFWGHSGRFPGIIGDSAGSISGEKSELKFVFIPIAMRPGTAGKVAGNANVG